MSKTLSKEYHRAVELHKKICVSAQIAQDSLWDMCSALKEMRDGKLYKELGYQNFEDYCETEFNMSRANAHKYISIIENINAENVSTSKHFGVSKLYLLSTLSEAEQAEITEKTDVESLTVKQLRDEIKALREERSELIIKTNEGKLEIDKAKEQIRNLHQEKLELRKQVAHLQDDIDVLEARPIEVAVTEPSDDVRQLRETIKNLERTTEEELETLQDEHLRDVQKLHRDHTAEMARAADEWEEKKRDYEARIRELEESGGSDSSHELDTAKFKLRYDLAKEAFQNLVLIACGLSDRSYCYSQVKVLLGEFAEASDTILYGRD